MNSGTNMNAGERTGASFPRIPPILAMLGLLCSTLHTAAAEPPPPPLRLGFLVPPEEPDGSALRAAAENASAVHMDNCAPAAGIIVRGGQGQWGDDATEAARLALDDAVHGLITPPDGTASHLVLQVAGRTALPVVSLCPDSSVIGAGIPWLVQIVPDTRCQATALLRELQPEPSAPTSWHALVPEHRPGREIAHDLKTAAATFSSITLTITETPAQSESASNSVIRLARLQPPVILLWLDAKPAARWAALLRQKGYSGILAGPERLRSERFVRAAGAHAEGFIVPSAQTAAPIDALAGYTHDAVLVLRTLNSLQPRVNSGAPLSFEPLPAIGGMTGPITFDPSGRREVRLTLSVYREGQWIRKT